MSFDEVDLMGMRLCAATSLALLDHVFDALQRGEGGWIVTANLDILRRAVLEPDARAVYAAADIRVADGMPLVWGSRIAGAPLPERVAGSSLTSAIAARAAKEGRSLYLLGGDEGAASGAERALCGQWPSLRILGTSNPWVSKPATDDEADAIAAEIGDAPDILLVGLGSPKQEYLIEKLRTRFPRTWFMGVGITFSFLAEQVRRAPEWMQRAGVEWVHRMFQDPGRLVRRYLIDDLPFAAVLAGHALRARIRRH